MRQLFLRLWDSPTLTSWGNYAVESLRLILVTPLLVTRFNETEIAAWYLFASLNFFGALVSSRFGLTFSRMFAFAMGGASDLSPVAQRAAVDNSDKPNWTVFERAYGTLGVLLLVVSLVNLLVSVTLGFHGLTNLVADQPDSSSVWLAFAIMQGSQLVLFNFKRYEYALIGMNYVALNARWGMLTSLASVGIGFVTLAMGGSIVALVLAMQVAAILTPLRIRYLLSKIEGGVVFRMSAWRFEREAFLWGWAPSWKGFLAGMGATGAMQIVAILYTSYGTAAEVATYLFSIRMMDTLVNMCQIPYTSIQPGLSSLLARGNVQKLAVLIRRRFRVIFILSGMGMLLGAVAFSWLLGLIKSNVNFMASPIWLIFGGLVLINRFVLLNGSVLALGNDIRFYRGRLVSLLLSVLIIFVIRDELGVLGPVLATVTAPIIILGIRPVVAASRLLAQQTSRFLLPEFVFIWLAYCGFACCIVYFI